MALAGERCQTSAGAELADALARIDVGARPLVGEAPLSHTESEESVNGWAQPSDERPQALYDAAYAEGTTVLVTVIVENVVEGLDSEEILRSCPVLDIHIDVALACAAELARDQSPRPPRPS